MGKSHAVESAPVQDARLLQPPLDVFSHGNIAPWNPNTADTPSGRVTNGKANDIALGIYKDTLVKLLFSLVGAVTLKLGIGGYSRFIDAFPTLYEVYHSKRDYREKWQALSLGLNQLVDLPGEDGEGLALLKSLFEIGNTLVGGAVDLQAGALTLVDAQNRLARLKALIVNPTLLERLPAHYGPGLAHAIDVLDALLGDAFVANSDTGGSFAGRMALRLTRNEQVLSNLPQRAQWTLRLLGAIGQTVIDYRALTGPGEQTLQTHGELFVKVLASSQSRHHLIRAIRDRLVDNTFDPHWLQDIGRLLLSVSELTPFPYQASWNEQWQWCLEWSRSEHAKALIGRLVGRQRLSSLQLFLEPATSDDPVDSFVTLLMPEPVQWLVDLFKELAGLRARLMALPPSPPSYFLPWNQAAQMLAVILESPLADRLLPRLPERFDKALELARQVLDFKSLAPREQWRQLMKVLADPERSGWLLQMLEPGESTTQLIEGLATAQQLLRHYSAFPDEGGWKEQLGWGIDLLGSGSVRPLLGLLLPEPQVNLLLAPFEWINTVSAFPHAANARVQAEWIARAVDQEPALAELFPGTEALQGGLELAPLIFGSTTLSHKAEMALDIVASPSAPAVAARGVMNYFWPNAGAVIQYGSGLAQAVRQAPPAPEQTEATVSADHGLAANVQLKALGARLSWLIIDDPKLTVMTVLAGTNPSSLALLGVVYALREIDVAVADTAAGPWTERVWQLMCGQFGWLKSAHALARAYAVNAVRLCKQWLDGKAPIAESEQFLIKVVSDFKKATTVSAEAAYLLDLLPLMPVLMGTAHDNARLPDDIQGQVRLARAVEYLAASDSPMLRDLGNKLQGKLVNGIVDLMLMPVSGRIGILWGGIPGASASAMDDTPVATTSSTPTTAAPAHNEPEVDSEPTYVPGPVPAPWRPARLWSNEALGGAAGISAAAFLGSAIWTAAIARKHFARQSPERIDPQGAGFELVGSGTEPERERLDEEAATFLDEPTSSGSHAGLRSINRKPRQWFQMLGGLVGMMASGSALFKAYETWSTQTTNAELYEARPEFPDTSYFNEIYGALMERYGDAIFEDDTLFNEALNEVLHDPTVLGFGNASDTQTDESAPSAETLTDDAAPHAARSIRTNATDTTLADFLLKVDLPTLKADIRERRSLTARPIKHVHPEADEWIDQVCGQFMPLYETPLNGSTEVTVTYGWNDATHGAREVVALYPLREVVDNHFTERNFAAGATQHWMHFNVPNALPQLLKNALYERMPANYQAPRVNVAPGWRIHPQADAWITQQTVAYPQARHLTGASRTLVSYFGNSADASASYEPLRETVSPDYAAAHMKGSQAPSITYPAYPAGLAAALRQGMPHDEQGEANMRPWNIRTALLRERLRREYDIRQSEATVLNPDDPLMLRYTPRAGQAPKADLNLSLDAFMHSREKLLDNSAYRVTPIFPATYSASTRYRLSSLEKVRATATSRLIEVFIAEVNALYRPYLKGQGLQLGPQTLMDVRYEEQLIANAPLQQITVRLPLKSVVDPGFKQIFSDTWYPRRMKLQVGFMGGFPSRRLAEIRDLLAGGLPKHYAPWGRWTRDTLLQQINKRSRLSTPIDRKIMVDVEVRRHRPQANTGGVIISNPLSEGSSSLVSSHKFSINDYLSGNQLPIPRPGEKVVARWRKDFYSIQDGHFTVANALEDPVFRKIYANAEKQAGQFWGRSDSPWSAETSQPPEITSLVPGTMAQGVFVPEQYATRRQYDHLIQQSQQRFQSINAPILEPERYIQAEVEQLLGLYRQANPATPTVSGSDEVVVHEVTRQRDQVGVADASTRVARAFKLWQLLAGHHRREVALSTIPRYTIEVPEKTQKIIDWFEVQSNFNLETNMLAAAKLWRENPRQAEEWEDVIASQALVSVLERRELDKADSAVCSAIDLFLQGKGHVKDVTFHDWPLDGTFFLPIEGRDYGIIFSVDGTASYRLPNEADYAPSKAPRLEKSPLFQAWIKARLSVYHRYSVKPEHFDYKQRNDPDRPNYGSYNPYVFSGNYTLEQLPTALRERKNTRIEQDIDALVYTPLEDKTRFLLSVVRRVSQGLAIASMALGPGVALIVGLLSGAVDTAAAFAQASEALTPEEETSARRSAILSAAMTGIGALAVAGKVITKGADAAADLSHRWVTGYQGLRSQFSRLARRPNSAWRSSQSVVGIQPGVAGVLKNVYRVGDRYFISDGEFVFEVQPYGDTLNLLNADGKPSGMTAKPDPQNAENFVTGEPFDPAKHSADLDPGTRVNVDLGDNQPGSQGIYKGIYARAHPEIMNREIYYATDGAYTYEVRWDQDNSTWRVRRGSGQLWNDDPVAYDPSTGRWRRHMNAGGKGGTPELFDVDSGLTSASHARAVKLTSNACKSGINMLQQGESLLSNKSSTVPRRLARYFFGWDSAFSGSINVEQNMQKLASYAKQLRQRLNAFDPQKHITYFGEIIPGEPASVARSDISRYANDATAPYMEMSVERIDSDVSKLGPSTANQRLARTLVHEFTHLVPPQDFFNDIQRVEDVLYVPRFTEGTYDLTDVVTLGLYDGSLATRNADSYAHFFYLLQEMKNAPQDAEQLLARLDQWYEGLGELRPTTDNVKARMNRLSPSIGENIASRADRARQMMHKEAQQYILQHRYRLVPHSSLTAGERTARTSTTLAEKPFIRERVFSPLPEPGTTGMMQSVDNAWQAELRVERAGLAISPGENARLARDITPTKYSEYLNGAGQQIPDLGTLRRIPAGWRLVFIDKEKKMIHAMLSHGEGKFAGWGNAIIGQGHYPNWSIMDLAGSASPLQSEGERLFRTVTGLEGITLKVEQFVPLSPILDVAYAIQINPRLSAVMNINGAVCWDGVFNFERYVGLIDEEERLALRSATRGKRWDRYMKAHSREITLLSQIASIAPGYRVGFFNGENQMIHAMETLGEGKFGGINNGTLSGTDGRLLSKAPAGWAVIDMQGSGLLIDTLEGIRLAGALDKPLTLRVSTSN